MMRDAMRIAALGAAMFDLDDYPFRVTRLRDDLPWDQADQNDARSLVFVDPNKATFISEKPVSKRRKRRLRGKAKSLSTKDTGQ